MPGEVASEAVHPSLSDAHCGGAAEGLNMEKVTPTGEKSQPRLGIKTARISQQMGFAVAFPRKLCSLPPVTASIAQL